MAETAGLVQKLTVLPGAAMACVWIGPTPTSTALLWVQRDPSESAAVGAFENSMVDALIAAATSRREVVALHGNADSRITGLRLEPA